MKYLYLLIFFFYAKGTTAQTYIGPLVGMDYSNFKSFSPEPNFEYFAIYDTGFVNETPFYGFRAKQHLFNHFSLTYQFNYTEKRVAASIYNIIPLDGIIFKYFRNNVLINYKLAGLIVIGAGGSFNVMNSTKYIFNGDPFVEIYRTRREKGLLFTLGINYKNFNLEGFYYHGQTKLTSDNYAFDLYPIRSLGISLSYDIKILRGWKKNKNST